SSIAWHLVSNPQFNGSVLVVEKDPSYEKSSTAATNSCIRQQFSNGLNIRISQYGLSYLKNFRERLGGDPGIPDITLDSFGYLYLADTIGYANSLKRNACLHHEMEVSTEILDPGQLKNRFRDLNFDDILLGSHNPVDEGYFDGHTMFYWWKRKARENGAEYIENEVVGIEMGGNRVERIRLANGGTVKAGALINAAGPEASRIARMVGSSLPVEPRQCHNFVFDSRNPIECRLPLVIDPVGVHFRADGQYYLCGCPPEEVDEMWREDDSEHEKFLWENVAWPALAHRVPAFESAKVVNTWVGYYAYNTLDQNAVLGFHPDIANFIFANGFSGHGLQQSPAVGCGIAELVIYGAYRELDLSPLGFDRIIENRPFLEKAII
ncbi:MAG: FAD-binding oxidoreductase, partial [Gammaproteobacteria bacterium]|nr:FAD-binding oxidoreductase [Gammaproteobacteria bacterium]